MNASWHVDAKLHTDSKMSKVDYRNKVLPKQYLDNSLLSNIIGTYHCKKAQQSESSSEEATAAFILMWLELIFCKSKL